MRSTIHRICRLDGQEPTPREKWKAFYSLWRMASRHKNMMASMELIDCLRIVACSEWVALANEDDPLAGPDKMPVFLRRRRVEIARMSRMSRMGPIEKLLHAIMSPVD